MPAPLTLRGWEKFCSELSQRRVHYYRVADLLSLRPEHHYLVLKHDVEDKPEKALAMAEIEHRYNLTGTYYVQSSLLKARQNIEIFRSIQRLGHEIAYHFDVLDQNAGNWEAAIKCFRDDLALFAANGFNVITVCPHGNPVLTRNGWTSNKDFFRNVEVRELFFSVTDMVVDFEKVFGEGCLYFSDAGYTWKQIADISNNDRSRLCPDIESNLSSILDHVDNKRSLVVSNHPHRWAKSAAAFKIRHFCFVFLKKSVSFLTKFPIFKSLISKYYYIARKI